MQKYLVQRLLQAILTLVAMTVVVFAMGRVTGDPTYLMLSDLATEEDRAVLRARLGLREPLPTQYWIFISQMARGDFGRSYKLQRPVSELIAKALPNTLALAGMAVVIGSLIAIPLGVITAAHRGSPLDAGGKTLAFIGMSMPRFWLGIMLMMLFAVKLGWLPAYGKSGLSSYILPAFTMGLTIVAGILRLLRSGMLDVLDSEYIKMARGKGVPERLVLWKHALRNAVIPVLTYSTMLFAHALTGSVVIEVVFAWPGLGQLAIHAALRRDFPVLQAIVLLMTAIMLTSNMVADMMYAYIDPRIRVGARA